MTEKKRSPVIAPIYHAGLSALLTPGSAAANAGYGHSLAGVGMGRMLLPSLNSCFAATHVISFKERQTRWKQSPINSEDGLCSEMAWK